MRKEIRNFELFVDNQMIVAYTYGTSGLLNGMVTGLGGAIEKGVDQRSRPSGLGKALAAIMGYQFILSGILQEMKNE